MDDAGMSYHAAVKDFEEACCDQKNHEVRLQQAISRKGKALEMLHAAVQKLIASEKRKILGPDGGK